MSDSEEIIDLQNLPEGITLEDVLKALAAQSANSTSRNGNSSTTATVISSEDIEQLLATPFTADLISTSGDGDNNERRLLCPFCSEILLRERKGNYVNEWHSLHPFMPKSASSSSSQSSIVREPYQHWWKINQLFDFDNIGVTHALPDGETTSSLENLPTDALNALTANNNRKFSYLSCGTCDGGPLGICYMKETNDADPRRKPEYDGLYLAHNRIRYTSTTPSHS